MIFKKKISVMWIMKGFVYFYNTLQQPKFFKKQFLNKFTNVYTGFNIKTSGLLL